MFICVGYFQIVDLEEQLKDKMETCNSLMSKKEQLEREIESLDSNNRELRDMIRSIESELQERYKQEQLLNKVNLSSNYCLILKFQVQIVDQFVNSFAWTMTRIPSHKPCCFKLYE